MGHRDRAQRKLEGAGWDDSWTQRGDKQVQRTLGRGSMRGRRISRRKDLSWSTARLRERPEKRARDQGKVLAASTEGSRLTPPAGWGMKVQQGGQKTVVPRRDAEETEDEEDGNGHELRNLGCLAAATTLCFVTEKVFLFPRV